MAMSELGEYYAELWERKGARIWVEELARMYEIRSAIQRYADSPPLRILDFGCGTGWLGQFLAKSGKVTAANFELSAIERARAEYPFVDFRLFDEKAPLYGLGPTVSMWWYLTAFSNMWQTRDSISTSFEIFSSGAGCSF